MPNTVRASIITRPNTAGPQQLEVVVVISRPLAASNAIHLLTKTINKKKKRWKRASRCFSRIHITRREKRCFAQRSARGEPSPASLSLSQPAALQHRDPSPAHYRNSNYSIAPSYTPKSSFFKKVSCHPSTNPTCQNVLAHTSRSKRAVRACWIHS